jgi:hypothetical protein
MQLKRRYFGSLLLLLLVVGQLFLASTYVFFNPEYVDPVKIVMIDELDETSNSPSEECDESTIESFLEEVLDEDEKILSIHFFDPLSTAKISELLSTLNYQLLTLTPPFCPPELDII